MTSNPSFPLGERARAWAIAMTRQPSVNGSEGEIRFPGWLKQQIELSPHLGSAAACMTFLLPVVGDQAGRCCLGLLVRGRGPQTVVLTGHFDTVAVEDFGDLVGLACDPERLAPCLLDRLRAKASPSQSEQRAIADLEHGDFIPGRGLLDMKAGLAAGLAVCEAHACEPEARGNLLFLAVPDEEASSVGMRQVAASLAGLATQHRLDLLAAINLDSIADDGDGTAGRAIALGSIGKLLLTAFVVGRPAHACYPFAGINAGALAGAIAAAVEWAPGLTDGTRGVEGVAATLLSLKDSKAHYDVTTPSHVFASWNALSFGRAPAELLDAFRAICAEAIASISDRLTERAGSRGATLAPIEIPIIDFAVLKQDALAGGAAPTARFEAEAHRLAASNLSLPEQCRLLTEHLLVECGRSGPLVVIGFGSMPYLPVALSRTASARRLAVAVDAARLAVGQRHGTAIGTISHFPGISDLSFLGEADLGAVPVIAANTPVFGHAIHWPAVGAVAGLPAINAGPWGRDYHTPLERLHAPHAFEVLPVLVQEIAGRLMQSM